MKLDRTSIIVLGVLLLLSLLALVSASVFSAREKQSTSLRALLQPVEGEGVYRTLTGEEVDLRSLNANVLVVASWASWCPTCSDFLTALNMLGGDYSRERVTVVALNRKEPKATVEDFLRSMPAYPHVLLLVDESDYFFKTVGGYAMPEVAVYDEEGELIAHHRDVVPLDTLRSSVEAALAQ